MKFQFKKNSVDSLRKIGKIVGRRVGQNSMSSLLKNKSLIEFAVLAGFLVVSLAPDLAFASPPPSAGNMNEYDKQVTMQVCRIVVMSQGMFGALVMSVAGLVAIVGAAMGSYRAALNSIAVGLGAFLIRPIIILFFGDVPCGDLGFDLMDLFKIF